MRVLPLLFYTPSVLQDALERRGLDPSHAEAVARGAQPLVLFLDDLTSDWRDRVVSVARHLGVECLSGEGWVMVSGALSRLAALIRPGHSDLPAELGEAIGARLASIAQVPVAWSMARGSISLQRPIVVGVLNVTPDSFSDGGRFLDPRAALAQADVLVRDGADVIDVGGESTRPGRPEPVSPDEEWRRLEPVLSRWSAAFGDVPLSVDTVKSEVARRSVDLGAWIINDVSGFRHDPDMAAVCAVSGCGVVLMHSRGTLPEMATYDHADYGDLVGEVMAELERCVARALAAGVVREAIVIDPGLGFAKRPEHNWAVINRLPAFASLGFPIMVGPSRKRFVRGAVSDAGDMVDAATGIVCAACYAAGASLFRVHGVKDTAAALRIIQAIRSH